MRAILRAAAAGVRPGGRAVKIFLIGEAAEHEADLRRHLMTPGDVVGLPWDAADSSCLRRSDRRRRRRGLPAVLPAGRTGTTVSAAARPGRRPRPGRLRRAATKHHGGQRLRARSPDRRVRPCPSARVGDPRRRAAGLVQSHKPGLRCTGTAIRTARSSARPSDWSATGASGARSPPARPLSASTSSPSTTTPNPTRSLGSCRLLACPRSRSGPTTSSWPARSHPRPPASSTPRHWPGCPRTPCSSTSPARRSSTQAALYKALQDNEIGGAILDVWYALPRHRRPQRWHRPTGRCGSCPTSGARPIPVPGPPSCRAAAMRSSPTTSTDSPRGVRYRTWSTHIGG